MEARRESDSWQPFVTAVERVPAEAVRRVLAGQRHQVLDLGSRWGVDAGTHSASLGCDSCLDRGEVVSAGGCIPCIS